MSSSFYDELSKIASMSVFTGLPSSGEPVPKVSGEGVYGIRENIDKKIRPRAPELAKKLHSAVSGIEDVYSRNSDFSKGGRNKRTSLIGFSPAPRRGVEDNGVYRLPDQSITLGSTDKSTAAHEAGHLVDHDQHTIGEFLRARNMGINPSVPDPRDVRKSVQLQSEHSANRHSLTAAPEGSIGAARSSSDYWERLHRPTTVKTLKKAFEHASTKSNPGELNAIRLHGARAGMARAKLRSEGGQVRPELSNLDKMLKTRQLKQQIAEHNLTNPSTNPLLMQHLSPRARRVMEKARGQGAKAVNKALGGDLGTKIYDEYKKRTESQSVNPYGKPAGILDKVRSYLANMADSRQARKVLGKLRSIGGSLINSRLNPTDYIRHTSGPLKGYTTEKM